jgi:hydroxymethylpyrimidine/phosphomethylpyrimidine kinase
VLTFSAADPTCGAGLQADVLAIAALGCHPLSVLTGYTVQDTSGVAALIAVDSRHVREQAQALLAEMRVSAFKIGVLASAGNVATIAQILSEHRDIPVVLDPVLASGRGDALADDEMIRALRELVIPRTTLATPNSIEARRLGGVEALLELGCAYVLVTGAHEGGAEVVNTLYSGAGRIREDRWRRLPGSYHGSGCTLASSIAACIALGRAIPEAVGAGQRYTWETLAAGYRPGKGQSIPERLYAARGTKDGR